LKNSPIIEEVKEPPNQAFEINLGNILRRMNENLSSIEESSIPNEEEQAPSPREVVREEINNSESVRDNIEEQSNSVIQQDQNPNSISPRNPSSINIEINENSIPNSSVNEV